MEQHQTIIVDGVGLLLVQMSQWFILYTHFTPYHSPPTEDPAWKVRLRFPSTPDEIKQGKGSTVDFTLKARFSSPDGEAGVQEAQVAAEKAWHTLKAKRESVPETKGQL